MQCLFLLKPKIGCVYRSGGRRGLGWQQLSHFPLPLSQFLRSLLFLFTLFICFYIFCCIPTAFTFSELLTMFYLFEYSSKSWKSMLVFTVLLYLNYFLKKPKKLISVFRRHRNYALFYNSTIYLYTITCAKIQ